MPRERRPLPPGFGVIWTTVALDLVGFGMLFPVLATYSEELGATPTEAGLVVASFSLAQLVVSPFSGRLSDRIGRKPVLIASLVGTALGSLLTGLAGSLWVLFAARLLDGASGASVSVAQAAVIDVAPPSERPRLLGLLGAAFGLGFALGPAIGGIAALVDHRLPFYVAAAIAGVNAVVAVRRLPETNPRHERGALAGEPGGPARQGFVGLLVASFLGLVAFSAFEATFSLLAEDRFELTRSATYAVFFAIGVVLVVVQGGAIHTIVTRLGEAASVRLGFALNAVGLLLLAPPEGGWWLLVPALLLLCVGQGVLAPTLSSLVAARAGGRARTGGALGVQQAAGGLARVTGPALGGALFDHVSPAAPYYAGAGVVTVALLLMVTAR